MDSSRDVTGAFPSSPRGEEPLKKRHKPEEEKTERAARNAFELNEAAAANLPSSLRRPYSKKNTFSSLLEINAKAKVDQGEAFSKLMSSVKELVQNCNRVFLTCQARLDAQETLEFITTEKCTHIEELGESLITQLCQIEYFNSINSLLQGLTSEQAAQLKSSTLHLCNILRPICKRAPTEDEKRTISELMKQSDMALLGRHPCVFICQNGGDLHWLDFFQEMGLDINGYDTKGSSSLHWAIANAQGKTASMMILKYGDQLSFNAQDGLTEGTALHLAVRKGRREQEWDKLIQLLITHTNPNIQDMDGNTPLHFAYARREHQWIDTLKKVGASEELSNKNGQKPAEMQYLSRAEYISFLRFTWQSEEDIEGTITLDLEGRERRK